MSAYRSLPEDNEGWYPRSEVYSPRARSEPEENGLEENKPPEADNAPSAALNLVVEDEDLKLLRRALVIFSEERQKQPNDLFRPFLVSFLLPLTFLVILILLFLLAVFAITGFLLGQHLAAFGF